MLSAISIVNAGSDDTIHVCPGDYTLSPVSIIEKRVDLIIEPGAWFYGNTLAIEGDGSTISRWSPTKIVQLYVTADDVTIDEITGEPPESVIGNIFMPIIYANRAANIEVKKINLNLSDQNNASALFYFQDSDATLSNVEISGTLGRQVIYVNNSSLLLTDSSFQDVNNPLNQKNPIIGAWNSNVAIEKTTFAGRPRKLIEQPFDLIPYGPYYYYDNLPRTVENLRLSDVVIDMPAPSSTVDRLLDVGNMALFEIENSSISSSLQISAQSSTEVSIRNTTFLGIGDLEAQPVLTLEQTAQLNLDDSWFCGISTAKDGVITILDSCMDGLCSIARTTFVDIFVNKGTISINSGALSVEHSTFLDVRSEGSAAISGVGASISVDRSIFAESEDPVLEGELTLSTSSFNGNEPVAGGIPGGSKGGIVPIWGETLSTLDRCAKSVLLADDPQNQWLIDNQLGPFSLCRPDEDEDGFVSRESEVSYVRGECPPGTSARGGDCDDTDPKKTPLEGCPIDADEDGVFQSEDCNDHNKNVGKCVFGFSSGCNTMDQPIGALTLLFLSLCTRRTRTSARSRDGELTTR